MFSCQSPPAADYIFYNGKIFTARSENDFISAMAVKNSNIIATGTDEEILKKYQPPASKKIDLHKKLVLPGFHDAHLHFWNGSKMIQQLDLRNIKSRKVVLQKIREAAAQAQAGSWIIGRGWDHELWKEKKLPDKKLLDAISTEHYIYLRRVDGHASWVNSKTLERLGYSHDTPDPPGGKIMRYRHSKEPNGILFETADDPIADLIPEPTYKDKYNWMQKSILLANSLGLTSITDNSPLDMYKVYSDLYKNGKLSLRINFWFNYRENLDSVRQYIIGIGSVPHFLTAGLVKIYADGSLGSRTAYLLQEYNDDPGNHGLPQHSFEEMLQMVRNIESNNYDVGIHAIGDAGVRQVLDVYEQVIRSDPGRDYRFRIEHAQMIAPQDFKKFKELDVIASMQPSHCITDLHWAEKRIGKRARYAYTWKSFLEWGVRLAFGTDWPVEPLNPMVGLYAAVTRRDTLGFPGGGWYPEERISLGQAIMAYTAGAAFAARNEDWCGTLEPGKIADFLILDRDIFQVTPREILRAKVLATYIGGIKVFERK
ncbi:MAG: amidohydrolase [Calditrichia bacterium]